jgi:hypothetical protein
MYNGIHAPNVALPIDKDSVFEAAKPQAVKLLDIPGCSHGESEIARVCSWGTQSITYRLPNFYTNGQPFRGPFAYAQDLVDAILRFYKAGIRRFQVDNEGNWQWLHAPFGPWQYQFYMRIVVPFVREHVPSDVVLISPPLSYSPALWRLGPQNPGDFILDEWLEAYDWVDNGTNLWGLFDEAGANVYWDSHNNVHDPSFGTSYIPIARRSGKRVAVLECASDYAHRGIPKTMEDQIREAEYPQWIRDARASGVVSESFVYLWGGTPEWEKFRLTEDVARAMSGA